MSCFSPPAERMPEGQTLGMKTMNFEKNYDVVVAGGGMAGVAAALAAAEEGARVAVIEKAAIFGGLATSGLINAYLPICDGKGTQVSFSLAEKLLHASYRYGPNTLKKKDWGVTPWKPEAGRYQTVFSPSSFAIALDELLLERNVDCWLDTLLCAVETDSDQRVTALQVENKSGRGRIAASVFVDATGDADLVRRAGGRTRDGMNYTCIWVLHHDHSVSPENFEKHFPMAYFTEKECDTHGVSGAEVSRFLLKGRTMLREFYQEQYAKGNATPDSLYPVLIPTMPQYRVISCIEGKTRLSDGAGATRFEDSIGIAADWRGNGALPPWEIPYSSLIPESLKNVLAAGRSSSAEGEGWEITRVIPSAVVTGEAAGTAAALAACRRIPLETLPCQEVQKTLRKRGVPLHLPDVGLSYKN